MIAVVDYKDIWLDEFDVFGFRVVDKEEWEEMIEEITFPQTYTFGSHHSIEYKTKEEFLECLEVTSISMFEYSIVKDAFGLEFGHFPPIEEWLTPTHERKQ